MSLESGALVRRWQELWGSGVPHQAQQVAGGLGPSVNSGPHPLRPQGSSLPPSPERCSVYTPSERPTGLEK